MERSDFIGMSWESACDACKSQIMLIACSGDPVLRDAAKLIKDHGTKAGAGYIAASLYAEANGPLMAVAAGTHFYEKFLRHPKISKKAFAAISTLADGVAWGASYSDTSLKNWPVKISEKTLTNNHGILNFLLAAGLMRLEFQKTSDAVVATYVRDFLEWAVMFSEDKSRVRTKRNNTNPKREKRQ